MCVCLWVYFCTEVGGWVPRLGSCDVQWRLFDTLIEGSCESSGRRQWHPTPVLLPGKSHGRRSLVGCTPWGREVLDTTERLHFHFSLLCIGEGNGNPLQCSWLENPRDGGAWWAAIYEVTQSQTRLKRLSSSSSSESSFLFTTKHMVIKSAGCCWYHSFNIPCVLCRVRLFVTPWNIAHQVPLSMGFSGQEYWSGLPFLSPGDLPDPGTEPGSPEL